MFCPDDLLPAEALIYLSGPIRPNKSGLSEFRNNLIGLRVYEQMTREGFICYSPHLSAILCPNALTADRWLENDKAIIARCDCLLLFSNWRDSEGCMMELEWAKKYGLKVFQLVGNFICYVR